MTFSIVSNVEAPRIISYLSSLQERGALAKTCRKWYFAVQKENQDPLNYENYFRMYRTMFITDAKGRRLDKWKGEVGGGGSKKAVLVNDGLVVMIPSWDCKDPHNEVAKRWPRIVNEEVVTAKFLTSLGILTPILEGVTISFPSSKTGEREYMIPSYTANYFGALKERGVFVIDLKNPYSSTWRLREDFLFKTDSERFEESNWDTVVDKLLDDVAKITLYDLPARSDSCNLAVVKSADSNKKRVSDFEVRFFGFDFSSKFCSADLTFKQQSDPSKMAVDLTEHFNKFIEYAVWIDCGEFILKENKPAKALYDRLILRYRKVVEERIAKLATPAPAANAPSKK